MKEKFQRFGGAMFTPILFISVFGIAVALCTVFKNQMIFGNLAAEGTLWYNFWSIAQNGAFAVFNNLEILFVASLPLGLANKAQGKAAITSLVAYVGFNTLVSNILTYYGNNFGIDFLAEDATGLKMVAGVRTLDTGVLGAIVISLVVVYMHNRFYDKKLPQVLGTFQGSSYVVLVSFMVMIPIALATCLIWPKIQVGIFSVQGIIKSTGIWGVGLYAFLERFLLPTGLHHFVWQPFMFGPAVIEGGISPYYLLHMQEFADSTRPLIEIFPEGMFGACGGNVKFFPAIGIALAFYFTADPSRRKRTMAIVIPAALTAIISGITEPLEFLFLFAAPPLFAVYAIITGLMAITMSAFGVVSMGGGLLDTFMKFWLPMFSNHSGTIFTQIIIGLIFSGIYFLAFRYMIVKFNYKTPGRGEINDLELQPAGITIAEGENGFLDRAKGYLSAFGGKENIETVNNCATRLRIKVKDDSKVQTDEDFMKYGAHGVVRNGKSFQVIVGLDVQNVRAEFDKLIE